MHMMHAWDNQHLGTHNFESSGSGFVAVSIPVRLAASICTTVLSGSCVRRQASASVIPCSGHKKTESNYLDACSKKDVVD